MLYISILKPKFALLQASIAPSVSICAKTEFSPQTNKPSVCIKSVYCIGTTPDLEVPSKGFMGTSSLRGPSGQIHPDTNTDRIRQLCIYYPWMQTWLLKLLRHWETTEVVLRQLAWSHQCRKQVMGLSGINSLSPEGHGAVTSLITLHNSYGSLKSEAY